MKSSKHSISCKGNELEMTHQSDLPSLLNSLPHSEGHYPIQVG